MSAILRAALVGVIVGGFVHLSVLSIPRPEQSPIVGKLTDRLPMWIQPD